MSYVFDLSSLGYGSSEETAFEPYGAAGLAAGRIGAHHRGGYVVFSELGELHGVLPGRSRSAPAGETPAVGDWVALHWEWICDKITETQVRFLKAYTDRHMAIANTARQLASALG